MQPRRGELTFNFLARAAHGAIERRASAGLLFLFVSRQATTIARHLARVRIGELAREIVLQREHDFARLAMRQLTIRRAGIERQLVTRRALSFHRDRREVLAIGLESMTVGAVHRLAVAATEHLVGIQMLLMGELQVRLFLRLVQFGDQGLPFIVKPEPAGAVVETSK